MSYKKLTSVKVTGVNTATAPPTQIYNASSETIISKIYIHNLQGNADVRVHVFFVDTENDTEYDETNDTIAEDITRAFDILIPSLDTAIFGSGVTLAKNQRIYVKAINGDVTVHVFGKIMTLQI